MEGLELISFQIISAVGTARSSYIEAIHAAKAGRFEEAEALIKQGQEIFIEGHHAHASLIQQEADGEPVPFALLLMHAEDQLMSAEAFGILAEEFVAVYQKMEQAAK
ncbi:PTS lactose/cellobiose transporter subunit IIA [Holdemania filiformis]|uniref:PTS lactose/cellobiose transporter subunit IIA n=1 Tax=Holdemania filiformis TaxID=61171 RepID=UPI00242A6386|nr:PTS lactose/cellobiose transporter subunit IIA [Holdemania filiformis]